MGDSTRRLAAKVVAGVGLLVAGCSESRNSEASSQQLERNRSQGDRTATPRPTPQEQPTPTQMSTETPSRAPRQSRADTPTESSDRTPSKSASGGTTSTATPTSREPTATEQSSVSSGGSASGGDSGSAGGAGTSDSSTGESDGSSPESTDEAADEAADGTTLSVVGEDGTAPFSASRTISLEESAVGYLCELDLKRPFVTRYSFAAADGRPLNCYLLPHDELDALRRDESHVTCLSITSLPSFEMGPFKLSTGRYAIVVEQADSSSTGQVDVKGEFELLREA